MHQRNLKSRRDNFFLSEKAERGLNGSLNLLLSVILWKKSRRTIVKSHWLLQKSKLTEKLNNVLLENIFFILANFC